MATVPGWITKAVIYASHPTGACVYPISAWRPTRHFVVVSVPTKGGGVVELRFRLAALEPVSDFGGRRTHMILPPGDPRVLDAIRESVRGPEPDTAIDLDAERATDMTNVPDWIADAVIVSPTRGSDAHLSTIHSWRTTKTQVVVTDERDRERRFYLDTLTEVGQPKYFPQLRVHLAAPDAPEVVAAKRAYAIGEACWRVVSEMERQRFQDRTDDVDAVVEKLTAVRDAANAALAGLVDVL